PRYVGPRRKQSPSPRPNGLSKERRLSLLSWRRLDRPLHVRYTYIEPLRAVRAGSFPLAARRLGLSPVRLSRLAEFPEPTCARELTMNRVAPRRPGRLPIPAEFESGPQEAWPSAC